MDLDEYNRFLTAACDIAAVATKDRLEFMDSVDGISLDDESRLMLCVSSPNEFDEVDEIVSNFNACYTCASKKEKTA